MKTEILEIYTMLSSSLNEFALLRLLYDYHCLWWGRRVEPKVLKLNFQIVVDRRSKSRALTLVDSYNCGYGLA